MAELRKYLPYVVTAVVLIALAVIVVSHLTNKPELKPVTSSDNELKEQVQTQLTSSGSFANDKIKVEVHNGVAFLKGTVSEDWKQVSAGNLAASIPGVVEVKNMLQVKHPAAAPAEAPWNPEADARAKKRVAQMQDTPELKAQALVEEGQRYLAQKNHDAAIKAFKAALAIDPNNFAARSGLQEAQNLY